MNNDILICIFNYRHDENAKRWLELLYPHFETVVLDSGNDHEEKDFIQFPNIYYSGLFNEMKKLSEKKDYKWIGQICSDVEFNVSEFDGFVSKINSLKDFSKIGIWQPGQDDASRKNWTYNPMLNKDGLYSVNIIEGWMHFIRKDILDKIDYIDTEQNLYGYGIDIMESLTSTFSGFYNIRDTRVKVHNPAGTGYNQYEALMQGDRYMQKMVGNDVGHYSGNFKISKIEEDKLI